MDKKTREELYKNSSELIKGLYSSEDTGEILKLAATKVKLDDKESYRTFALSVGDIILGLYKKTSLSQILKDRLNLGDDQITIVINELKILLDKIPETATAADYVNIIPPTTITPPTVPTPENEPLVTVKPMRTFPDDFNAGRAHSYGAFRPEGGDNDEDEPIHSSSQDDVLRK